MPVTLTGNRFLITTYKNGGESNYAKLVPLRNDAAPNNHLERWWTARPAHRYGENAGVFDATVVRNHFTTAGTRLNTAPHDFALHPNYNLIMPVWAAGDLAIVPHCGVLAEPLPDFLTDIPNYRSIYEYPRGVGAHDIQQILHAFMNANMAQSSAGWIGRVMDLLFGTGVLSTHPAGMNTIVIAPSVPHYAMHKGDDVIPYTLPRLGARGPSSGGAGITVTLTWPNAGSLNNLRTKALEAISLAANPDSVRHQIWLKAVTSAVNGGDVFQPIQATNVGGGAPTYTVDAHFGQVSDGSWWKSMFHRIARTIEATLNANAGAAPIRMALAASVGDYDTHGNEKARFEGTGGNTSLVSEYGEGLKCLRDAMMALGCWNDCVVTDPSDFGRNLWTQGGLGTDHAWAYAMFIAGGLVRGAGKDGSTGIIGPYPDIISIDRTGTRDWQVGGIEYPYRSLEEVYDPILEWMGLTVAERNAVMVNRTRFSNFVDVLNT